MPKIFAENEKESLSSARAAICPFKPGLDRVIVIQVRSKIEKVTLDNGVELSAIKTDGGILLPSRSSETYTSGKDFGSEMNLSDSREPVKAVIKAIRKGESLIQLEGVVPPNWIEVGDIAYVFPNTFEAKVTVDEIDFMTYHERDIVQTLTATD